MKHRRVGGHCVASSCEYILFWFLLLLPVVSVVIIIYLCLIRYRCR